jgi:hypothetical protein
MLANPETIARLPRGNHRSILSSGTGPCLQARTERVMSHALTRFVACVAWLIALASIVSWAAGYALQL